MVFILEAIISHFFKVGAVPIGDVGECVDLEVYLASFHLLQLSRREPAVREFFHKNRYPSLCRSS